MTDILVGHAYFMALDARQQEKQRPYPPLSTMYAAGQLRRAGYDVAVFDAMLQPDEEAFATALEQHRPRIVVIAEDNFNFLSKMCLSRVREATATMIAMARRAGCRVIVGGSDASDHPEAFLAAGAEAVLLGEYEHTVVEVVARFGPPDTTGAGPDRLDPETVAAIAGIAVVDPATGAVHRTATRPNERHPDSFGVPARDLVDHEAYRRVWTAAHGSFSMNMVSTRGCPFHCNWCAKPIWGQRYAMRSAVAVAAELADVKRTIAPDHIWFADDIFGLRPSWLAEFAAEVERLDAGIPFTIQSRCDLMSEAAVDGLRRAGCQTVWLGAESGSQRILDAMDKGITVEEIRLARDRLGAAGIRAGFFIQFGYPGETWADIVSTLELIRDCRPDEIGVSVSYPLPGTRFHEMVHDQLGPKTHWNDSGDLEMMFRGTYTSEFYRRLHHVAHRELDAAHAGASDDGLAAELAEAHRELRDLERTSRVRRPTLLVKSEHVLPAPDLARSFG